MTNRPDESSSFDSQEIDFLSDDGVVGQPSIFEATSPTSVVPSSSQKVPETKTLKPSVQAVGTTPEKVLTFRDEELPQNMMGFLTKKGRLTGVGRLRYFTLEEDVLSCRHTEYSSPSWRVFVSECTIRRSGNAITLHLSRRGDITMVADDPTSAYQWHQALERAKKRGQDRFFSPPTRVGDVYRFHKK